MHKSPRRLTFATSPLPTYDDTCTIEQRIDEIVATGADVHIEMLAKDYAWMKVGSDVFSIRVERGKLVIAWRENRADPSVAKEG